MKKIYALCLLPLLLQAVATKPAAEQLEEALPSYQEATLPSYEEAMNEEEKHEHAEDAPPLYEEAEHMRILSMPGITR